MSYSLQHARTVVPANETVEITEGKITPLADFNAGRPSIMTKAPNVKPIEEVCHRFSI